MTSYNPMSEPQACTRHHRRVWMASCDECTAWHLAALDVHPADAAAPEDGTAPAASAA